MIAKCIYTICSLDCNVASLLQLGDEFQISRLIYQCEKHLRESKTFNPVIMSHLAKQYHLESLLEYSYSEISKIEGIEDTQEFQLLDSTAQNRILKFLLKRYKNASKTLSQFDVHLCNHHGSDPKNNECCFRAATYSTENNRIFLVSMEQPEKKLIERYQSALDCDSRILLKSQQKTHLSVNNLHSDRFHSVWDFRDVVHGCIEWWKKRRNTKKVKTMRKKYYGIISCDYNVSFIIWESNVRIVSAKSYFVVTHNMVQNIT